MGTGREGLGRAPGSGRFDVADGGGTDAPVNGVPLGPLEDCRFDAEVEGKSRGRFLGGRLDAYEWLEFRRTVEEAKGGAGCLIGTTLGVDAGVDSLLD